MTGGAIESSRARSAARRPLSLSGALALLAVASVLVVVSVPRLRVLALRENEVDARATAQVLARALHGSGASDRAASMRELLRRPELRSLGDAELLAGGALLRRHGYLFELTALSPALALPRAPAALLCGEQGTLACVAAIRAWPWAHGSSGGSAFLVTAGGALFEHPNPAPHWQGTSSAGAVLDGLAGWRAAR